MEQSSRSDSMLSEIEKINTFTSISKIKTGEFIHTNDRKNLRLVLLIIDGQVCFSDKGSLPVMGSDADAKRVASLMRHVNFDTIVLTIDCHTDDHIAHQNYWKPNINGEKPPLYSNITAGDVITRKWEPINPDLYDKTVEYLQKLENIGRFKHTIWPIHGKKGSTNNDSADIDPILQEAIQESQQKGVEIKVFEKGMNKYVEQFSAFGAEVPDKDDETTQWLGPTQRSRMDFILGAKQDDEKQTIVVCCGQALSHCVNHSVVDLVKYAKIINSSAKFFLLSDGSSPVKIPNLPDECQPYLDATIKFVKWFHNMGGTILQTENCISANF